MTGGGISQAALREDPDRGDAAADGRRRGPPEFGPVVEEADRAEVRAEPVAQGCVLYVHVAVED